MQLRTEFQRILREDFSLDASKNILIAVSGGSDSMVLLDLVMKCGYKVGIAHINHGLREKESEDDAGFVESYAQIHNLPYYSEKIPGDYWQSNKNRHEAARQFRYSFLEKCAAKNNFHFIATAHHKDDDLETFFIRLKRGTGLLGLSGIPNRRNNIIRPLLNFTKNEILNYAKNNNIQYRDDSSNVRSDYTRNYLRNQVMPLFDEMEIKGREGLYHSMKTVNDDIGLFRELLEKYVAEIKTDFHNYSVFHLGRIKEITFNKTLLNHLFKAYGFNDFQCAEMIEPHQKNCFWLSQSHRIDLDKNKLYLTKRILIESEGESSIFLEKDTPTTTSDGDIIETMIHQDDTSQIKYKIGIIELVFPLKIRSWKTDDVFYPAGMHGKKKDIKKIISENKIPIPLRKNVKVLVNGDGRLLAVLPFQIDWRFMKKETEAAFLDVRKNGKSILYKN